MHTLDELLEIQIKFFLQSIFCLLLKGNHSLFSVGYNMYNESFNMVSVRCFFHSFNDVGNANWSLVIHCLRVRLNDSFEVVVTFTMGSEEF